MSLVKGNLSTNISQYAIEDTLAGAGMGLIVTRKSVKNINFRVKPAQLCVSSPYHLSEQQIQQAIAARLSWAIRAHQRLIAKAERMPKSCELTNFTLWGQRYPIRYIDDAKEWSALYRDNIVDNLTTVKVNTPSNRSRVIGHLLTEELYLFNLSKDNNCKGGLTSAQMAALKQAIYREQLSQKVPTLLKKWQPVIGEYCHEWRLKKMRTRWGSCNVQARRVWLSIYLGAYPIECTEYVLVHELSHLRHANHSAKFWAFVEKSMPDYHQWHQALQDSALSIDERKVLSSSKK